MCVPHFSQCKEQPARETLLNAARVLPSVGEKARRKIVITVVQADAGKRCPSSDDKEIKVGSETQQKSKTVYKPECNFTAQWSCNAKINRAISDYEKVSHYFIH